MRAWKNTYCKFIWFVVFLGAVIAACLILGIDPGYFWERRSHLGDIILKMFPPDWSYTSKIITPILTTVQMSVTGTFTGSFFALLLAPLCSVNIGYPRWIRAIFKFLIQVLRSFPALILALAATFVFGLGAFAGTAALTVYTFAIMTRLTYEDADTSPMNAYLAVRSMGVLKYPAFFQTVFPNISPSYLTNALYMLESNVRQSAILGYVGAGGIGMLLNEKMSWREYAQAGMILAALFVTVCIIEWLSHYLASILRNERSISPFWRKVLIIILAAAFLVSTITLKGPDLSHTSLSVIRNMAYGFIHPDLSIITDFTKSGLWYLLFETILIAFLGTFIGAVFSFFLSILNAFRIMPKPIGLLFRFITLLIRSVPVLIYGLIFVRVTGQGAFTGVLTMAACSIGLLTKRFTQGIDALDFRAYQALRCMGISKARNLRHALLPQLMPSLVSAALYRFDINIREASILGLVGAGGIGTPLLFAMNHYNWDTAGAICLGLILTVWLIDLLSSWLRRKLQ